MEGEILSALLLEQELAWNNAFSGRAVVVPEAGELPEIAIEGGLTLTLLSPTPENLSRLRSVWASGSRARLDWSLGLARTRWKSYSTGHDFTQTLWARKVLIFQDWQEPNTMPIPQRPMAAALPLLPNTIGRKYLFAGDAFAETLVSSIQRRLRAKHAKSLSLTALKMSHHGSKANTSPELLELLRCEKYLISTDGSQFHHPDLEAIAQCSRG